MVNEPGTLAVDGQIPGQLLVPDNPDQVAGILKNASDTHMDVVPLGGGTMLELGAPLERASLVVSLKNLNRVLDYQPANLTVRAEAGLTLAALNQVLATEGQSLPLDPPCPDRATLGGILAANASGPQRVRYGTARDLMIGIRVALADGQIVRGGGQVVKNVAGYDLPKLFVGSLGTLGIIVEATFKLAPLPKKTGTVLASFRELEHTCRVASRVLTSPLLPLSIELLNPEASAKFGIGNHPILAIRFGGIDSEVERQLSDVNRWSREGDSLGVEIMKNDTAFWDRVRDFPAENRVVVKVGVLPSRIGEMGQAAEEIAQRKSLSCSFCAHAVGLLFITLEGEDSRIAQAIDEIGQVAIAMRGHFMIQSAPRVLRESTDVFGPQRNDWAYMRKIKHELDPNSILNPGRLLVG